MSLVTVTYDTASDRQHDAGDAVMADNNSDLGGFFKQSIELTEMDQQELEMIKTIAQSTTWHKDKPSDMPPAVVSFGHRSGYQKTGRLAFVQNLSTKHDVRVTIEVLWSQGEDNGRREYTRVLPPMGKASLGSTTSAGLPLTSYAFRVVKSQVA